MRPSDKFLKTVDKFRDFQKTSLSQSDVYFDDKITRSVLYAFLTRHYVELEPEHLTDYPEIEGEATIEDIQESFNKLESKGFIKQGSSGYVLNKDNSDMKGLEDAKIEFVMEKKYS